MLLFIATEYAGYDRWDRPGADSNNHINQEQSNLQFSLFLHRPQDLIIHQPLNRFWAIEERAERGGKMREDRVDFGQFEILVFLFHNAWQVNRMAG